jgi:glutamate dehydrogenase/leucine dehydrogenase
VLGSGLGAVGDAVVELDLSTTARRAGYDDTAAGIATRSGLSVEEVHAMLMDLKRRHLARQWESHGQITSAGMVAAGESA